MVDSRVQKIIAILQILVCSNLCFGQTTDEAQLRERIEKSLHLLEKASAGSADNRQCFTCHSQAIPVFAFVEAQQRGFRIHEKNLVRQIEHSHAHLERGRENYLEGKAPGGGIDTAGYALWTIEDGGRKPNEVTDAVIGWILKSQTAHGNWKPTSERPPTQGSLYTSTYLALRALHAFGRVSENAILEESKLRASNWLFESEPKDHEDRVFQLLSSQYASFQPERVEKMIAAIKNSQRFDGGWSQLDSMASDPYATSTALYALYHSGSRTGSNPQDEVWIRGIQYLLKTQLDDGSWHVTTRSKPIQTYFETGFPHEKDQFISSYATAWSTLVLLYTLPTSTP